MNDNIVSVARGLIRTYGFSLLDDPERLGQLLEDKCSDDRYEIFLLCFALREVSKKGGYPSLKVLMDDRDAYESAFCSNLGFSPYVARRTLDAIALILGDAEHAEEAVSEDAKSVEARRGFLRSIYNDIAKKPRTAPVRKKTLRNGLLLLAIIMLFIGLYFRTTETRYPNSGEHRLLYAAHLSGAEAGGGHVRLKGVQLAADMINASGGVKGRRIRVIVQDVSSSGGAGEILKALLNDRSITSIISSCGEAVNSEIASVADELEVPVIFAESSRIASTIEYGRPRLYSFRLNIDNEYKGQIMSYFIINALKRRRAALISPAYDVDAEEVSAAFASSYEESGGEIACRRSYTVRGGLDGASTTEIVMSGAECVVITDPNATFADALSSIRDAGFDGPIVAACFDDRSVASAGLSLTNCWWIVPSHPGDSELMSFQTSYRDKYNESVGVEDFAGTILAYDAVMWTADALARAPGYQGEALRHSFLSTRSLGLTHGTLTIDPRTHSPWNKSMSLLWSEDGRTRFQRRFRPR